MNDRFNQILKISQKIQGKIISFDDWDSVVHSKIVCVDFDDCLAMTKLDDDYGLVYSGPNLDMINRVLAHRANGANIFIVTARIESLEGVDSFSKGHEGHRPNVREFLQDYNITVDRIVFTNHDLKGPYLKALSADLHYDDDPEQISSAITYGVNTVQVI